ncbi:MAG TPA: adenylate/guanylate cyclase domain-containing protein [Stellaceae bacterium]
MAETARKLAAILAADVVGYSRLAGADEDMTLARLRALRSDLIDPVVAVHHGRLVKRTGDGSLVEFRSVVDATRCAIEIQDGMVVRNAGLPPGRCIAFRIGIHLGDVVEESDGDLMGDGVNIAARLEGIAEPGGICLSEDAYRQVRDKMPETFADLGEKELKNIARPMRVYSISLQNNFTAPAKAGAHRPDTSTGSSMDPDFRRGGDKMAGMEKAALALPDKPSIAVLPFQNMSGDPEQDYFADGMVEDIITGLSRINWLFVIARNSSFAYKGRSPDIRQVGRELGVRYVLEGSVRKGGNRLRITGQLIEAESGSHLWADKYDGALEDVFELQDRITESVVGVIEPSVQRAEIERARRKPPDSLGAYDLYLQALPFFGSVMPGDAATGMALMEEALRLDPHYAAAHAYLAWGLESRFARGGMNPADAEASVRHARLAVAHGGDDPTALAIASLALLHMGHDFAAASGAVERALSLNPSCAAALYFGAHIHAFSGDPAKVEAYAPRALRLSPFDPLSFEAHIAIALVRMREGRYAEAAAAAAESIKANPRFSTLYAFQAASLTMAGRGEEAKAAARRLLELEPNFRAGSAFIVFFAQFAVPAVIEVIGEGLRRVGLPE